tara:strand:- start:1548 stop:2153 length:606 start_codon:yes stop_codon:yes gene_type:complete
MKVKLSDLVSDLTSSNSPNRSNFIFSPKRPFNISRELSKISDIEVTSFIREESLNNNYFDKVLSLSQNVNFHCMISGINKKMFLQNNYLSDDYEDYRLKGFKKIPRNIWEKFEILLFLEINKVCLIEKPNFFKLINSFTDIQIDAVKKRLESKKLFFFSNNSNIVNIKEYFDLFLLIEDKAYRIFKNPGPFMNEAKKVELI